MNENVNTNNKKPQLNFSTDKVFKIIEYLAGCGEPVRLQTLSHDLNINNSTASRFLMSMEKNGYVCQDADTRKYMLTMKVCTLSHKVLSHSNLVRQAEPFLKKLANLFMEVTCLSVEQDSSVLYVANHDGPDHMLKSLTYIGKRAPMHCTGSGKLFLTNYSEEQLSGYLQLKGDIKPTGNSITDLGCLKTELESIGRRGYAMDNEECEIGIRCVAVPVRDYTNKIIAGLSVTGPAIRMTEQKINSNLEQLILASKQLSNIFGYNPA